jgi:hypothetical protein
VINSQPLIFQNSIMRGGKPPAGPVFQKLLYATLPCTPDTPEQR